MAIELLGGFRWDSDEASREINMTLTVADLFVLTSLNQDYGLTSKYIPQDEAMGLQEKLVGALKR